MKKKIYINASRNIFILPCGNSDKKICHYQNLENESKVKMPFNPNPMSFILKKEMATLQKKIRYQRLMARVGDN